MLAQSLLTPQVALWVLGIMLMPTIGWALYITNVLSRIRARQADCMNCHNEMLKMHHNPDEYGFGTISLRATHERDQNRLEKLIDDNTRALREVAHYIRWSIENTTGKKAPPPMPVSE